MKKILCNVLLLSILLTTGCGSDGDDKAREANEKKIDQQTAGISDEAKEQAKETADQLVELTSMSLTELEMSKLAMQKAANPQVKTFAQRSVQEHQLRNTQLRDLARQLSLTVPAELSKEGKDRIDDLRDEQGTAFDLRYLSEIASVNERSTDLADNLADEAPNETVQKLASQIKKEDKRHRDQARQMKNILD